jgi:hypothetical protein
VLSGAGRGVVQGTGVRCSRIGHILAEVGSGVQVVVGEGERDLAGVEAVPELQATSRTAKIKHQASLLALKFCSTLDFVI